MGVLNGVVVLDGVVLDDVLDDKKVLDDAVPDDEEDYEDEEEYEYEDDDYEEKVDRSTTTERLSMNLRKVPETTDRVLSSSSTSKAHIPTHSSSTMSLEEFERRKKIFMTNLRRSTKPLVDYNVPIIKKHDLEMIKTWYNPPPISPDLPTLFYDDTGAIKHMPKPKHLPVPKHAGGGTTSPKFHTSGIKIQQPSANSVKGLSTSTSYDPRKNHYKNTGINMIHFGTDFSSSTSINFFFIIIIFILIFFFIFIILFFIRILISRNQDIT